MLIKLYLALRYPWNYWSLCIRQSSGTRTYLSGQIQELQYLSVRLDTGTIGPISQVRYRKYSTYLSGWIQELQDLSVRLDTGTIGPICQVRYRNYRIYLSGQIQKLQDLSVRLDTGTIGPICQDRYRNYRTWPSSHEPRGKVSETMQKQSPNPVENLRTL